MESLGVQLDKSLRDSGKKLADINALSNKRKLTLNEQLEQLWLRVSVKELDQQKEVYDIVQELTQGKYAYDSPEKQALDDRLNALADKQNGDCEKTKSLLQQITWVKDDVNAEMTDLRSMHIQKLMNADSNDVQKGYKAAKIYYGAAKTDEIIKIELINDGINIADALAGQEFKIFQVTEKLNNNLSDQKKEIENVKKAEAKGATTYDISKLTRLKAEEKALREELDGKDGKDGLIAIKDKGLYLSENYRNNLRQAPYARLKVAETQAERETALNLILDDIEQNGGNKAEERKPYEAQLNDVQSRLDTQKSYGSVQKLSSMPANLSAILKDPKIRSEFGAILNSIGFVVTSDSAFEKVMAKQGAKETAKFERETSQRVNESIKNAVKNFQSIILNPDQNLSSDTKANIKKEAEAGVFGPSTKAALIDYVKDYYNIEHKILINENKQDNEAKKAEKIQKIKALQETQNKAKEKENKPAASKTKEEQGPVKRFFNWLVSIWDSISSGNNGPAQQAPAEKDLMAEINDLQLSEKDLSPENVSSVAGAGSDAYIAKLQDLLVEAGYLRPFHEIEKDFPEIQDAVAREDKTAKEDADQGESSYA